MVQNERKPHRIEPVPVYGMGSPDPDHWACDVCGQPLYRVRNGWRHDPAYAPERPATWPRRVA